MSSGKWRPSCLGLNVLRQGARIAIQAGRHSPSQSEGWHRYMLPHYAHVYMAQSTRTVPESVQCCQHKTDSRTVTVHYGMPTWPWSIVLFQNHLHGDNARVLPLQSARFLIDGDCSISTSGSSLQGSYTLAREEQVSSGIPMNYAQVVLCLVFLLLCYHILANSYDPLACINDCITGTGSVVIDQSHKSHNALVSYPTRHH